MEETALVKLKSDFENYQKTNDETIKTLQRKCEEVENRIHQLEINNTKTDIQYEQIMESLKKLNDVTIPNLSKQIEALKNKPAERYNLVVTTGIGSIVGGIVGYILKAFVK